MTAGGLFEWMGDRDLHSPRGPEMSLDLADQSPFDKNQSRFA